jgi:putative transposase
MKIRFERNKTSTVIVMYSLYLYFLGLSLRNTSKALIIFKDKKRSHVSVLWNWIQRFAEYPIYKRKRVSAFIIDETVTQIDNNNTGYGFVLNQHIALCLECKFLKKEKYACCRKILRSLIVKYGKYTVCIYSAGGRGI